MNFSVGSEVFTARAMSGLDQIEVVSRLMSVGEALKEIFPKAMAFAQREKSAAAGGEDAGADKAQQTIEKIEAVWDLAGPVAKAIAKMPSEDKQFVINTCLKLIDKKEDGGTGWSPIFDEASGRFMYQEYKNDGAFQLIATLRVLAVALGPFFRTFLQSFAVLQAASNTKG